METIKIAEKEEPKDDKMKITDLNDYCLEHIFNYLSLEDLIDVAQTNTILQNAALLLFKHKYGDKRVMKFRDIVRIEEETIGEDRVQCFMLIFGDMIESIEYWCHTPEQHIHFKNLKQFRYEGYLNPLFYDKFPFSFNQLEKLRFSDNGMTIHQIDEIIKQNEKLVKVTLKPNFIKDLKSIDKVEMLGKIPRITFESDGPWLFHDRTYIKCGAIVNFLNQNCFASRIKFKHVFYIEVLGKKLEENLDKNKWNLTISKASDGTTNYTIIIKPKVFAITQ